MVNYMKNLLIFSMIILLYACSQTNDTTQLQSPAATEATNITNEWFTANWNSSPRANDYELDVATDAAFTAIIRSIKNLGGPTLVDNLNGNTEYFYRVRATLNGENASGNSNVISTFTLPDAPEAISATNISSNGFMANWNLVPSITDYLLYVSLNNFPATPPNNLPGYDGKEVTGTSDNITGLNSGTIYYYVVKAKNGDRISSISNSIEVLTNN
jgi:hypothetical protein